MPDWEGKYAIDIPEPITSPSKNQVRLRVESKLGTCADNSNESPLHIEADPVMVIIGEDFVKIESILP